MSHRLGFTKHAGRNFRHVQRQLLRHRIPALLAAQDRTRIEFHILGHALEGRMISSDLNARGNRTADNTAATGHQEHDVCTAADEIHQPLIVVRIRDAELHPVRIRCRIQQPESRLRRWHRHLRHALNRSGAALHQRTHRFFLDRTESTREVTGTDRVLPHGFTVVQHLVIGIGQLLPYLLCFTALHQHIAEADRFDDLLEDRGAAEVHELIIEAPDDCIARETRGIVRASALRTDHEIL